MILERQILFACTALAAWFNGVDNLRALETYDYFPSLMATLNGDRLGEEDLTITAPHPHRYEFGIITPKGELLFIYATLLDDVALDNPNEVGDFWTSTTLSLNTSTLKGISYEDGRPITKKVFTEPGLYCLHFSSNFETEPGGTHYQAIDIQWPSPTPTQKGLNNGKCQDDFFNGD